jgi:site-specific DNA-methyltransferase (cytosine-N4-specific)
LLQSKKYNSGKRPSEHKIGEKSFFTDHNGSIAHNFFELEPLDNEREVRLPNAFSFANTCSADFFHIACKKKNIMPHPARMPIGLASFFIQFLTDENDLVLDPFAGSNTTGYIAALLKRRWMGIEIDENYIAQARLRFENPELNQIWST